MSVRPWWVRKASILNLNEHPKFNPWTQFLVFHKWNKLGVHRCILPKVYYFCQNTSGWPYAILNNHNWFKRTNIYKLSGLFATFSILSDFIWPYLTSMTAYYIKIQNQTPFQTFRKNLQVQLKSVDRDDDRIFDLHIKPSHNDLLSTVRWSQNEVESFVGACCL